MRTSPAASSALSGGNVCSEAKPKDISILASRYEASVRSVFMVNLAKLGTTSANTTLVSTEIDARELVRSANVSALSVPVNNGTSLERVSEDSVAW